MSVPAPPIITCPQWRAQPAKIKPRLAGRPVRSVFHHTAGHAPAPASHEFDDWSEAVHYAAALQRYHVEVNGWSDSGHNFLVMRSGLIVQGRWGTVTAIEHGRMVVSAHCPGQNDQPGIEHEHVGGEELTSAQLEATVWLHAWIFDRCKIRPTAIEPHNRYYNTTCPANLTNGIWHVRQLVAAKLNEHGRGRARVAGPVTRARFAAGVGLT